MTGLAAGGDDVFDLADRFFKAIERCDMVSVRAIYTDDAIIWHSYDSLDLREMRTGGEAVRANLALLGTLPKLILGMQYELWHYERTASGFLRQHLVTGKTEDGAAVRIPVCVVCRVEKGRIDALYEYVDAGQLPASILNYFAEQAQLQQ